MKKIITLLLMVLVAATITACGNKTLSYNAVLYDNAVDMIKEDFQNENLIKCISFIEDDDSGNDLPTERSFIVTNRENFENIFVDDFTEFEVDFDSEMIIIYTFAIEYVLPAEIKDMTLNDKTLTIDYKIQRFPGTTSAVKPFQRWFVIKLDKLEITSAVFNEHDTYYKK